MRESGYDDGQAPATAASGAAGVDAAADVREVVEQVVEIDGFGFGILTRSAASPSPVVLVLLNAGLTHRVGPFRGYVQMARAVAARGTDVFRFDLPRVGDGPADGVPVDAMITAVFDTLERELEVRRFALGGICSAADMAWRIARGEPRVQGVWLLDGFAHRGKWYRVARVQRALRRPPWEWPRRLLRNARQRASGGPDISVIRDWSDPAAFRDEAAALLARGAKILAIYTGGVIPYLQHPRQLDDTFGRSRRHAGLSVDYLPAFDHTLMGQADRGAVAERLGDWLAGFAPA